MDYTTLLSDLFSRHTSEIKFDLLRVTVLSAAVGNPHHSLKAIHVAGSNGKGSVCTMIHSILCEEGYRVGLYTSPHLQQFNERIKINDAFISKRDVARLYGILRPHITDETFFEITTVMAFLYFKEKKCDYAIIEVGLGGRLDATNIITPILSLITSISLEHTNILGTTLPQIAQEKAGIIKPYMPIITSARGEAKVTIKKIALKRNAPFLPLLPITPTSANTRNNTSSRGKNNSSFSIGPYKALSLPYLQGNFQRENARLAVSAIDALKKQGIAISLSSIRRGLQKAHWPARLDYLSKNLLIDCAHNLDGARMLCFELQKIRRKKILVVGILKDKDYATMMRLLCAQAEHMVITSVPNERSAHPLDLAAHCPISHSIVEDPLRALKHAQSLAKSNELIVATGSIYLVGLFLPKRRMAH